MSIYATLWTLKFPLEGDATLGCDWITVRAQAVPAHIGTPTSGHAHFYIANWGTVRLGLAFPEDCLKPETIDPYLHGGERYEGMVGGA